MAGSQSIGSGDDASIDYNWLAWFSACILLVVIFNMVLKMARSGSGQDGQRPNEDRGALMASADDGERTTKVKRRES